jgi:hypothetical protein
MGTEKLDELEEAIIIVSQSKTEYPISYGRKVVPSCIILSRNKMPEKLSKADLIDTLASRSNLTGKSASPEPEDRRNSFC